MELSAPLIEEPCDGPARAALVWLHGLGASAHDFAGLGRQLQCPSLRVVAMQAPVRPVTMFDGQAVPSWFDIRPLPGGLVLSDLEALEASAARVRDELERQRQTGIEHLAVGGFSQGGAMALYTALTHPEPLAAAVCLSGYLPQDAHLRDRAEHLTWRTPIFCAHGTLDGTIPVAFGAASRDWLAQHGASVRWSNGAYAHEVHPQELAELGAFLRECLA